MIKLSPHTLGSLPVISFKMVKSCLLSAFFFSLPTLSMNASTLLLVSLVTHPAIILWYFAYLNVRTFLPIPLILQD
jgi:hypothetical protein